MSTDEYVPSDEDFIDSWACAHVTPHDMTAEEAKDAARAFLARVRRDAAREALDGLYEDASQDYRIGLQGDDRERMDAAEAVMRATYAWMDDYPEETP